MTRLKKANVAEIIDSILTAYEVHYVYPDTARDLSEHIRKRLADGTYDDITDLATIAGKLSGDMRSFTNDKHICISVISSNEPHPIDDTLTDEPHPVDDTTTDAKIARRARTNFGIRKAEWLVGNIGYLRFDYFDDAEYAGEAAAAAMNFIGRCDAAIIDLRYNVGGEETMLQFLASYFFKKPIEINALYYTETDSMVQTWTSAYMPGRKLVDADLYILISHYTASGGEAFSYSMKHAGRAVLIGETTIGAAHMAEFYDFPKIGLRALIPIARAINPVTKTNWEGTGVAPDIEVPSENALVVAHREALKGILERTSDEELRSKLSWHLIAIEAQTEPVILTPENMLTYTGEYAGERAILVKNGALYWRYVDGTESKMIAYTENLFGFDDTDEYRLAIIRDDNGLVTGFRLLVQGSAPGQIRERTGDIK
jgi:C-terminal processing protease CtpA/Prc